ncbi:DUF3016 domain-containing protein [Acidovorax sp. LjRoot129]|uniref:DUF3016 domain-containing protein n=1 Tax=Acidovorax sp. LjRoot129 TaxID=3342260 RepID=UPI003ECCD237
MTTSTGSRAPHGAPSVNSTASTNRAHGTPRTHSRNPALQRAQHHVLPLLAACLIAGCAATGPEAPPAGSSAPPGAVRITYADAAGLAEARNAPREPETVRRAWLDALALHLAERAAPRLREGQRLEVQITDAQRAGGFEPGRGPEASAVRIVRDIYPPRIDLRFKLLGADGGVLREGTRALRDSGFLMHGGLRSSDPLQHEKALLDGWIDKEFAR